MTTKQNHSDDEQNYTDAEYALYCESLEEQYKQAKEDGVFEVLKILELDEEHSDNHLVEAIKYLNEKDGLIEKDAPIDFLNEREKKMVAGDGNLRQALYCMLLSIKLSKGIENKSLFLRDSFKFAFDES